MLDKKFFLKQIDELVFYQDFVNGSKLYRELSDADNKIIKEDEDLLGAFLVLKFIIIPRLSTGDIADLFREHLTAGLMIDGFDLKERITKKLLFMDLRDRDNCKNALKTALLSNNEIITDAKIVDGKKIKTAADWVKDYISKVGLKDVKSLEQAKYFSEQNYVVSLDEDEKSILHKIIDLYKFLNISSLTPEGFEDDLLLKDKNGRLITTDKGKMVILYDPKKLEKRIITNIPSKVVSKNLSEQEKEIIELRKTAESYPAGSFERKAIEEEIEKLNNKNSGFPPPRE